MVEARRLWKKLGVPNVMVKIPGTVEGVPAIEQCISEGLNINVTLLFSQDAYVAVAEAYIRGLEKRAARGEDVSQSASVASFFVSRIDTLVEKTIAAREKAGATPQQKALFDEITGKVAIANAKQAYRKYKTLFSGPRWQALADKGAKTQRVLWASTGHEESEVLGRPLRRGADRSGDGEHHPAGDARRLPRPRQGPADPGPGAGRGRHGDAQAGAGGHLDEGGHRPAGRRGVKSFSDSFQELISAVRAAQERGARK